MHNKIILTKMKMKNIYVKNNFKILIKTIMPYFYHITGPDA